MSPAHPHPFRQRPTTLSTLETRVTFPEPHFYHANTPVALEASSRHALVPLLMPVDLGLFDTYVPVHDAERWQDLGLAAFELPLTQI
jgi:hypothetical protein